MSGRNINYKEMQNMGHKENFMCAACIYLVLTKKNTMLFQIDVSASCHVMKFLSDPGPIIVYPCH